MVSKWLAPPSGLQASFICTNKLSPRTETEEIWTGSGKGSFIKGVAIGRSTTVQWMVPHPEVYGWYKQYLTGFINNKLGSVVGGAERCG